MARRQAAPLEDFPGDVPENLAEAYAVQEEAIALWPDTVAGWKVAAIHPDLRAKFQSARMSGPVFSRSVYPVAPGGVAEVPVIRGGFMAVETEIGILIGADISPRLAPWTLSELKRHVASVRVAMEIAGSPLISINDIGPCAVVSDFGNNTGVAIGVEIPGWDAGALDQLKTATRIDGRVIGEGAAFGANGGPLEAALFLVNHLATRGRGLNKGDVISSGATTGVHPISIGQLAEAICVGLAPLSVRITERRNVE
jgi:2-keto-4-pentenoate hydratase